jgi:hypothetical protein
MATDADKKLLENEVFMGAVNAQTYTKARENNEKYSSYQKVRMHETRTASTRRAFDATIGGTGSVDDFEKALSTQNGKELAELKDSSGKSYYEHEAVAQGMDSSKFTDLTIKARFGKLDVADLNNFATISPTKRIAIRARAQNMTADEAEILFQERPELLDNAQLLSIMKPKVVEKLVHESKVLFSTQKGRLKTAQIAPLQAALTAVNPAAVRTAFNNLSTKTASDLDIGLLTNAQIIPYLSVQHLQEMKGNVEKARALRAVIAAPGSGVAPGVTTWLGGRGTDFGV